MAFKIDCKCLKVSSLRWKLENDSQFVCGTFENEKSNQLLLCQFCQGSSIESCNIQVKATKLVPRNVDRVTTLKDGRCLVLMPGHVSLVSLNNNQINDVYEWRKLADLTFNDSLFHYPIDSAVVCGEDGILRYLNVEKPDMNIIESKLISKTALTCISAIGQNELICGNAAGYLKLIDVRRQSVAKSFGCQRSCEMITCVNSNPSNGFLVACGNDLGHVSLWDLRGEGQHIHTYGTHSAYISDLQYMPNDSNTIFTSSYDGQLFKWSMTASAEITSVDCLHGSEGDTPINSFHINHKNQIIFASEREALHYGHV